MVYVLVRPLTFEGSGGNLFRLDKVIDPLVIYKWRIRVFEGH